MGCKCQSNSDKTDAISFDINFDHSHLPKPIKHSNNSPQKHIEEKDYILTSTKTTSFTDHLQRTNAKMSEIDKRSLCHSLLKQINFARESPQEYIAIVEKYKELVHHNHKGYYLLASNKTSINLKTGIEAFDNCINFLKKQEALQPLTLVEKLSITIPKDTKEDDIIIPASLSQALRTKTYENIDQYIIDNFHYDKSISSSEISCLMQIIDDTGCNFRRRKNIFNATSTVIGINCEKINNSSICFLVLLGHDRD